MNPLSLFIIPPCHHHNLIHIKMNYENEQKFTSALSAARFPLKMSEKCVFMSEMCVSYVEHLLMCLVVVCVTLEWFYSFNFICIVKAEALLWIFLMILPSPVTLTCSSVSCGFLKNFHPLHIVVFHIQLQACITYVNEAKLTCKSHSRSMSQMLRAHFGRQITVRRALWQGFSLFWLWNEKFLVRKIKKLQFKVKTTPFDY